jgi:hypothetical protein
VINQSGNQVEQRETSGPNGERMVEVLIMSKVKEAIGGGALDKTFQQAFGLRRQGY